LHIEPGAQSLLDAQPTVQAAFTQAWGEQSTVAPARQWPVASQVEAALRVAVFPDLQAAAPQTVPSGRGAQVPDLPARLHALQAPQERLWQQTWSVHMPLKHWALVVQAVPSGCRLVQVPDWQVLPVTQSPSEAQLVRQPLPPHRRCPGQACDACVHRPAPLQALTVAVDPVQVAAPQLVPALTFRHTPAPSQVPSKPQGGLGGQSWCGSALPAGTGWQDPATPATLQAWQLPQDGAEQQTPSTQAPLAHWPAAEQICPSRLSPHDPALQVAGGTQSPSPPHAPRQLCVVGLQT